MSVLSSFKSLASAMQPDPPSANSNLDQSSLSDLNTSGQDSDENLELSEGNVMCIELHEEIPKIDREVVVREKVQIKKVLMSEAADSQPE